ncbi:MAG: hypothetical protein ACP5UA_03865 [Candidatus Hydrogenedens sp.]
MPTIKYICPQCGKKFVEWGAQKFDFKCPNCRDVQLQRIGISSEQITSTPKIRRKPRLVEDEGDIEFPEGYAQEEEFDDFGVPDVPIIEDEEIPLENDIIPSEEIPPEETEIVEEDLDTEEE